MRASPDTTTTKKGHPAHLDGDGMTLLIKSGENPNMTSNQSTAPVDPSTVAVAAIVKAAGGEQANSDSVEEPEEITCPGWCTRGDEHVDPTDSEHWTDDVVVASGHLLASAVSRDGGLPIIEIASGDFMKVTVTPEDAAALAGALVKLVADLGRTFTKKVILND